MPVRSMHCPRCGRAATEYDENRWRCLFCDNKFIYEPPPADIRSEVVAKDGIFICESCKQARETDGQNALPCDACGKLTCRQCLTSDGWGNPVCRDCADTRHREFRASPDGRDKIPNYHFFASVTWLAIISTAIAIPAVTFRYQGPAHLIWAIPTALFAFVFLFSRTFSGPNAKTGSFSPLYRFPGSLVRFAIIAGGPIYLTFLLAQSAGVWNLIWAAPLAAVTMLVLAAVAMEV